MSAQAFDVAIVGGGVVGSALGYGFASKGARVVVLDEGDSALRASRVNFGLVWLQTKGNGMPAYGRWSRKATELWPDLARELLERTGIDVELELTGGLKICLGEEELRERGAMVERMAAAAGPGVYDTRMLGIDELGALLPEVKLGPDVTGASFCPHEGAVNPLHLLNALQAGLQALGGTLRTGSSVESVARDGKGFAITCRDGTTRAGKVVLAAGHGTPRMAAMVGLPAPIKPQRGQILVTERMQPFMPLPASGLRQTKDGTVMLGATRENVGFDVATTMEGEAGLAARAVRIVPALAGIPVVRAWAGLRILTPDTFPVYHQSESHPGAYVALCHSGVTLASVHARVVPEAYLGTALPEILNAFHPRRFDVQKTG
ncbi:MAG: FAD-dependent oxidoreductase [Usitatibacter sp.]